MVIWIFHGTFFLSSQFGRQDWSSSSSFSLSVRSLTWSRKCGPLLVYCPEGNRRTQPAVAMKWPDRTAQAFRPGKAASSARPEGATESVGLSRVELDTSCLDLNSRLSVALSGRMLRRTNPGLKTWAVLSGHFMATAVHAIDSTPTAILEDECPLGRTG
jgi:hypothetical protein